MNPTKHNEDRRSEKLDYMIQDALRILHEDIQSFSGEREKINDFIMGNPDLPISADQIEFLLQFAYPAVNPKRGDYFDLLARLVSEAKAHGDPQLVKSIYLSIPFFREDQNNQRKLEFYEGGIQYFLSLGLHHIVGEIYANRVGLWGNTAERIRFSDKALEFLDPTSKEYACIRAMREMLCYMEHQGDPDCYHYHAFGETVFSKGESIFLSQIYPFSMHCKREEALPLCFDENILKGYSITDPPNPSASMKEIVDQSLPVYASKCLPEEMEMIRWPDETVICQADGKEYPCRVFSVRRTELFAGDMIETHYFARGIGLIRSVLSVLCVREYVYDLCAYTIKGGDGFLPCCVGNRWCYRQEDCPDEIDQVIEREIIAQNGEEYLLSGWNYAGRKPGFSCDANNGYRSE